MPRWLPKGRAKLHWATGRLGSEIGRRRGIYSIFAQIFTYGSWGKSWAYEKAPDWLKIHSGQAFAMELNYYLGNPSWSDSTGELTPLWAMDANVFPPRVRSWKYRADSKHEIGFKAFYEKIRAWPLQCYGNGTWIIKKCRWAKRLKWNCRFQGELTWVRPIGADASDQSDTLILLRPECT